MYIRGVLVHVAAAEFSYPLLYVLTPNVSPQKLGF
jgi:hypothetical protein